MAEKLKSDVKIAVGYCRYSSELQREESIQAQTRSIVEYAKRNGYVLRKIYADRAVSGTSTDKRLEFQNMIADVKNSDVNAVIVNKFDRFARNRYDAAVHRKILEKEGIQLLSVTENFSDTPESIILQSVIEGYNEYYSKNLSREVMKGLKENAFDCRTTGGVPCLGYDIDKDTKKYVINTFEAEAVKTIFKMYLEGEGYRAIINELNSRGFKTKRGAEFGKNSLYEILRNEKYTGVYIYNLTASKNSEGKFNRHKTKSDEEVIRIEGGVPQIISKEDFQKVQEMMEVRKHKAATYKAKHEYLLTGKIVCGCCNSTYAGNSRRPDESHPVYISYRCTRKNDKLKCNNHEIQRDKLESIVLKSLAHKVFDDYALKEVITHFNAYAASKNVTLQNLKSEIEKRLAEINKSIDNIVNIVMQTGSAALTNKLSELEADKAKFEESLSDAERRLSEMTVSERELKKAFKKARNLLETGSLANKKAIVNKYVKQITIHSDKIVMEFNVMDDYVITEEIAR